MSRNTGDGSRNVRPYCNWLLSDEQMSNQVRVVRTNQTSRCGVWMFCPHLRVPSRKLAWNLNITQLKRKNHLPNLHFWGSMLIFQGVLQIQSRVLFLFHENLKIRSFSHGFYSDYLLEILGHPFLFCRLVVYEFHSILDSKIYHTLPETNIAHST